MLAAVVIFRSSHDDGPPSVSYGSVGVLLAGFDLLDCDSFYDGVLCDLSLVVSPFNIGLGVSETLLYYLILLWHLPAFLSWILAFSANLLASMT